MKLCANGKRKGVKGLVICYERANQEKQSQYHKDLRQ